MENPLINSMVDVKFCTGDQCLKNTEYYCHSCQKDLCRQCQQQHASNLDTKHHNITLYKNKVNHFLSENESCPKHSERVYKTFCESCNIPICLKCKRHRKHKKLDILTALKNKREHLEENINEIRNETIYKFQILLSELKPDVKKCRAKLANLKSVMTATSRKMKDGMDIILGDGTYYEHFMYQRLSQLKEMKRYIGKIQIYEEIHEQSDKSPIRFLQFVKTNRAPRIKHTPRLALYRLLPFSQDFSTEDLVGYLKKIKITEGKKRHAENEKLLKFIIPPVVQNSYTVKGIDLCYHISCVTPDRVWVNDRNNIVLADVGTDDTLHQFESSSAKYFSALHTVNNDCELIYINDQFNIKKLSKKMKTKPFCTFSRRQNSEWRSLCLYHSPSTGDLLVGKTRCDTKQNHGKIERYNKSGQLIQTVEHDIKGQALYKYPRFITENNNGYVVVSDTIEPTSGVVVVTNRNGKHRFTYTGHPAESKLTPLGICTDALSQILVCDFKSRSVHIIDKNGQFLSSWPTLSLNKSGKILTTTPFSLSYDVNTHLLWVGSGVENTVSVFRYLNRHTDLEDKIKLFDAVDETPSQ